MSNVFDDRSYEDLQLAVKHGAQWLDETREGWRERIDVDKLLLSSCQNCVLGQEFERDTRLTMGSLVYTGFGFATTFIDPPVPPDDAELPWHFQFGFSGTLEELRILQDLWVKEIGA